MPHSFPVSHIRDFVAPYYAKNDPAHHLNHGDDVYNLACKMNAFLPEEERMAEHLILIAAYCHDIYARERKVHELLSHDFVMRNEEDFLQVLSQEERHLVAMACKEHRASYKGEFTSKLSEIISCADRGLPTLKYHYDRSVQYGMHHLGLDEEGAHMHAASHMIEKYGREGYVKYTPLYKAYFADQLEALYVEIDGLMEN